MTAVQSHNFTCITSWGKWLLLKWFSFRHVYPRCPHVFCLRKRTDMHQIWVYSFMDWNSGVSGTVSVSFKELFIPSARDDFFAFSHREMYCSTWPSPHVSRWCLSQLQSQISYQEAYSYALKRLSIVTAALTRSRSVYVPELGGFGALYLRPQMAPASQQRKSSFSSGRSEYTLHWLQRRCFHWKMSITRNWISCKFIRR